MQNRRRLPAKASPHISLRQRKIVDMRCIRSIGLSLLFVLGLCLASPRATLAQDEPVKHGRKYKAPPATSHIEVTVVKKFNGKPIVNAAVIFNSNLDGKDEGNLEVKTDPDGKAIIDVIPTGSSVRVQVIATGFATYAEDFVVTESTREISRRHDPAAGTGFLLSGQLGQRPRRENPACRNQTGQLRRPPSRQPRHQLRPPPPATTPQ